MKLSYLCFFKNNILKVKVAVIFILFSFFGFSQSPKLSPNATISMITVAPGESLNDTWGHSAIRIKDNMLGFDVVYNYGTYDFNTPNFYTKFMRGKLLYDLGVNQFHNFYRYYKQQNRSVVEQVLNLNQEQKQAYFNYLQNNARPENKKYLYDFFFDNCATKLRFVNSEILKNEVVYKDELLNNNKTFRDLIYQKLEHHPWGKYGIDIALGAVIDRKATPKEYTFLPSYIYENFKTAQIIVDGKPQPLVAKENILFKQKEQHVNGLFFTPFVVFSVLALLVFFLTYLDVKNNKQTKKIDFILLFTTGLVGLLVVLLWFATDHTATKNNLNIFWAFFPNLIVSFYVFNEEKNSFLKKYYLFLILLLVIMAILWFLKIQVFNLAMLPIMLMLFVRYAVIVIGKREN